MEKLILSKEDVEKIVHALENPGEPNDALKKAARKYKLDQYTRMAEEAWEGCDGCDSNDKYFFMSGYITAMYAKEPDSDSVVD